MIGVLPSAFQRGEAERLLPVAPALGEGPERAQGPRQPRPGLDPHVCTGRARLPVRRLHVPPQQLGRPAEVAEGIVYLPQVIGWLAPARRCRRARPRVRGPAGPLAMAPSGSPVSLSAVAIHGQHPSQPGPVVERPGQGLGLAQQGEAPPILSQCAQRACHSEAEIDGQHPGVAVLGQVREGLEGLVEVGHRLAERGAVVGPGAGLLAVGHGLVPHLAPQGMVRQAFDLLGHPVGRERLEGLDQARVQHPPPLQQEAAVGHLVRQGMLEGVFLLGEQAGLIQELRRLQVRQATVQRCLGQLRNGLEQGQGHLGANHGSRLQEPLLLRRQPVDACRQHGLHRGRHLNGRQRLRQAVRPRFAHQHPGLHQGAHALLQEEGVALGARNQELLEGRQAGIIPQQGLQELRRRWPAAAGRAAVACSTSCCPSRAGTPGGS